LSPSCIIIYLNGFDSISQLCLGEGYGSLVIIFWISKFFGQSITKKTWLVEMGSWCIEIGIVWILHRKDLLVHIENVKMIFTLSWCRKYVQESSGRMIGRSSLTHLSYVSCNGDETSLSDCSASNGSSRGGYRRVQISCSSGKTHHLMVKIISLLPAKPKGTISLSSVRSVCPSVYLSVHLSVCLSFCFQFSRLFSAMDKDIQLIFDIWLHLIKLQTKFEFRYAWKKIDWIIPLDVHI
jgi:hypothetical protein